MLRSGTRAGWVGAVLALAVAACDTSVTNPGPIQGEFLNDPEAQPAMVDGMGRALSDALNWIAYTGAAISREVHPGGSTGSFGITASQQKGNLRNDEVGGQWIRAQRARGMSESFLEIIAADPVDPETLAQAYLYGGFSYRLMGENMCEYVVDGGTPGDRDQYLTRAVALFDQAASTGDADQRTAAIAGRAGAKVHLGDWAGAVADAAQVPTAFSYALPYFAIGDDDQANRIHRATKNVPYRAHTQWNTWHADVGFNSADNPDGDPRLPWMTSAINGDAALDCCGQVPWWPQQKYPKDDAAIELASGAEMRLIEAEDQLMKGNVQAAVDIINQLRTAAGVDEVSAATVAEGYALLKRERGIELWLEGRRLPDLWRWKVDNTPGDLDPLERVGPAANLETRCYCFPVSEGEVETNPNISTETPAFCAAN